MVELLADVSFARVRVALAAAILLAGCSVDRGAIDSDAVKTGQCITGMQKPCTCASGDKGFNVCRNGIYSECLGCPEESTGGTGGSPAGGTGGAIPPGTGGEGGAEPVGGTGGEPPLPPPAAGAGGGTEPTGGTGGIPPLPPPDPGVSCPPPFTCQTSTYAMGISFCAQPGGGLGPMPPLCQTEMDCDLAGLPDAPCLGAMGMSACIMLCVP